MEELLGLVFLTSGHVIHRIGFVPAMIVLAAPPIALGVYLAKKNRETWSRTKRYSTVIGTAAVSIGVTGILIITEMVLTRWG